MTDKRKQRNLYAEQQAKLAAADLNAKRLEINTYKNRK